MQNIIDLEKYTYELPDEKIAKFPLEKRSDSKLLHYNNGEISHEKFDSIADLLPEKSFLVFNNTKVIPARLLFQKDTGTTIQLFLLHPQLPTTVVSQAMLCHETCVWECMIGNRKKFKSNEILTKIISINNTNITVSAHWENEDNNWVRFSWKKTLKESDNSNEIDFLSIIQAFGEIPLPPYLNRETTENDLLTYQTVYSEKKGAVAAPTAGLHFTTEILEQLKTKHIGIDYLTLHVGAGTFQPIKVKDVVSHKMHNEQLIFTAKNIANLIQNIDHIIPVGTTSMRALESLYWFGVLLQLENVSHFFIPKLTPYQYAASLLPCPKDSLNKVLDFMSKNQLDELTGETEIFIFPGYDFKICKKIITNFHQPESTLILLIAALVGDNWKKIYQTALDNNYRFLSYGDSSLLIP